MGRSGYTDDFDDDRTLALWRGQVSSAIRGARGQKFLRELRDALDAMPVKRLIAEDLQNADGEVCAIGAWMVARGIDAKPIDPEDHSTISDHCDIAYQLVQEIEFENDDDFGMSVSGETPEARWQRMRGWVEANIKPEGQTTPKPRKAQERLTGL